MKTKYVVLLHILFWLSQSSGIWFYLVRTKHFYLLNNIFDISIALIHLAVFYINYFLLLPKLYKPKRYFLYGLSCLVVIVAFTEIRYLLEEVLFRKWYGVHNYYDPFTWQYYALDNFYHVGIYLTPSFIIWNIVYFVNAEKKTGQLLQEKAAAENNFLRTQINPHFLFNTLNNIYSLVYHHSDKALPAIQKLSELMRYVTIQSQNNQLVPLAEELQYIEGFVELESLRISPKAYVSYRVEGDTEHYQIAPLLLIPFIENGFKHGDLTDPELPFQIDIKVENNQLQLSVANKKKATENHIEPGIGLENVRKRLALLYPDQYHLEIDNQEEMYICHLSIHLQKS